MLCKEVHNDLYAGVFLLEQESVAFFPSKPHRLLELPETEDEKKIAEQFRSISVFRFKLDWIRLLDNSLGFGSKEEIELKNQTWLIKE